ncbi:5546_t:CDS:2, partial [Gigaspora margarita]
MPRYADTIVRIKCIHMYKNKNDRDSMIVWAISTYPVDREDSEVEIVSFVSTNPAERDPETQAVFEKDSFYSIRGKIISVYYGDVKRPKHVKIEDVDTVDDVSVDSEKINFNLDEGNMKEVYCNDNDKRIRKDKRSKSLRSRKSGKGGVSHSLRSSSK